MTEQEKKFLAFIEDDNLNNRGRLINSMDEIRFLISHPAECEIFRKHYLNDILMHATLLSNFYKPYINFKSLSDFPIVNKNVYRDNWNSIVVKEYANLPDSKMKFTSGSTGIPFKMVVDRYRHCRWIAGNKVFRELVGLKSHDKAIFVSENILDKKIPIDRQIRDNLFYVDLKYLDQNGIGEFIDYLVRNKIHYMTILASALTRICNLIKDNDIKEWKGQLSGIVTMSDALTEATRKTASEFFKCPVIDMYGNEEFGVIASEDGSGNGMLVNTADLWIEVLSLENDAPVNEGEVGRLVITDLHNKAFPIIRYEIGDLAALNRNKDGKLYLTRLAGRKADMLYTTKGVPVFYFQIISILEQFQDIRQFQLIQNNFTEFVWVLNTKNHSYEDMIIKHSKSLLGQNANFSFEYVDELPKLRSGKTRMTVCNIKND